MAQGQYYTRQQLNQLAQERIASRNRATERKREEEERIANDPRRKQLARLIAARDAKYAFIDKELARWNDTIKREREAGTLTTDTSRRATKNIKALNKERDDARRNYFQEIRTVERAIAKDISISEQESRERSSRARRAARFAPSDQESALRERFGDEVYGEMSPEARDYAYAQLQGRTTPTPNTARMKDEYNRAQEVRMESYKSTLESFDAAVAAKQAERNPPRPRREDFQSSAAYSYALEQLEGRPRRNLVTSLDEGYVAPSDTRAAGQAFLAGFTADRETADAMGLNERNPGLTNLAYGAGQIAYIPARVGAAWGVGRVVSGVTGAGIGLGGSVGGSVGGVGGRFATGQLVGSSVGKVVGGFSFAAPPTLLTVYGVTEFESIPVNRALERRGVNRADFRAAYSEALGRTGGFGELNPVFANQERFEANLASSLSRRGINPTSGVLALGNQQRRASGVGDAFGLVVAGAAANVLGARLLSQTGTGALYRTPIGVFSGGGFRAIGAAGVLEGGISSYGQNVARFEPFDNRRAAIAAGFGGVSAGLLGGYVAGTAAAGQSRASGFYEGVGFAADPSEFGSDVLTAGNPYGSARFGGVFAASPLPLSTFEGGSPELQPTLTKDFGIPRPAPSPRPADSGRPRGANPFVTSQPFARPQPLVDIPASPEPAPFVPVSPAPRSNPNPFVPVNPAPTVPVAPAPFVPVAPNPVPNVPSQPLVDVPVTKLFLPGLGAGRGRLPARPQRSFGVGFSKARYTPSFAALELGIGASKINGNRTFSGFEIRPFLAPERKKKKKGKRTTRRRSRARAPLFSLQGVGL